MLNNNLSQKWNIEILSWLFVVGFCVMIVGPIYLTCGNNYTFYIENIISIVLLLTLARYIFLLSYTPFSRNKILKLLLIFLPIPLLMYQVDNLMDFRRVIDEDGTIIFFKGSSDMSDYQFGKYIKFEYLFFSIASIVTLILLPIRMIISFWRTVNTKDRV